VIERDLLLSPAREVFHIVLQSISPVRQLTRTPSRNHFNELSVEKVIPDLLMKSSPLGRPQETPLSRARLEFPGSTPAAFGGGYFIPSLLAAAGAGDG